MDELARQTGADTARGRIILAHLGNGASLTAVKGGQPVDTTMAFTPAGGIPMGTRSGDLDPGLMAYFARVEHMSPDQFETMANFESGLLGMSETSADMQELLAQETEDSRALEAVTVFCYKIKKAIGAYTATMGGLDQLVFAGGIGENAPVIRGRICNGLECLDIKIHTDQNKANAALISRADSIVKVRVIATDEERVIADSIVRLLDVYNPDK